MCVDTLEPKGFVTGVMAMGLQQQQQQQHMGMGTSYRVFLMTAVIVDRSGEEGV